MRRWKSSSAKRKRKILRRFLNYADKYYRVRDELGKARDCRKEARIPCARVVQTLFLMASARLGSLNAIEQAMRGSSGKAWRCWIGGDVPSADRLGEVAALLELDDMRRVLLGFHRGRKRKKAIPPLPGGLRVLIMDAHEMWTSYHRRCKDALSRTVKVKTRNGEEERTQYYQRYVAAYLMGMSGRLLLDLEMQRPGEGEIAAAQRLLRRLLANCPRAFNVVAGDALYLDPDLCRLVLDSKKDFIAVLKNENRILIQDFRGAMRLENKAPERFSFNGKDCVCHDIEGFTTWAQLGHPVRVVRSMETRKVRRQSTRETEELCSEWLWATSLSTKKASTQSIVRIGHGRWSIENQGFNELVRDWHADHVYHLDTNAVTAILLLIFLAYNLFHVWLERGLKCALRNKYTADYFASHLFADFYAVLAPPG